MTLIFKWFYMIYSWGQDVIDFFTMTINDLVGRVSLAPPWNDVVDYLTSPFGNWSLIQFIFGVGFATVIVLTLVKWAIGIIT